MLELFGDKARARALAQRLRRAGAARHERADDASTRRARSSRAARRGDGQGGRRRRRARHARRSTRADELDEAYARCRSEARAAFGNGDVYVEAAAAARAPRRGADRRRRQRRASCTSGERECTLQRRHQKLVEIAPSPRLDAGAARARCSTRRVRIGAGGALRQPRHVRVPGRRDTRGDDALRLHRGEPAPAGRAHRDRGGDRASTWCGRSSGSPPGARSPSSASRRRACRAPRGFALQVRVNAETMGADGSARPAGGTLARVRAAVGPRRARRHAAATPATRTNPRFDSLLAKVIVHAPSRDFADVLARSAARARRVPHRGRRDQPALPADACCAHPEVAAGRVDTRFVEEHAARARRRRDGAQPRASSSRDRRRGARARRRARRRARSARRARPRQGARSAAPRGAAPTTRVAARRARRGARADAGHDRRDRRRARASRRAPASRCS